MAGRFLNDHDVASRENSSSLSPLKGINLPAGWCGAFANKQDAEKAQPKNK
jgi:hypothetical protein